ncbi:AAA domain-containing protein [Micromonospora tarensis]|uniref:AAA family ATPase n=1 Tax=Micromonospora tarensis TaxID=2806100 RepID=A0ABS1YAX0_9ACTN|nr:AAA domain-containing protein [Micromonospora tarensis]MBM0274515.1 AAA family ATPase [Micromonospora tarensis]
MPDWRDEVCTALDFWISSTAGARSERLICVGRARQEGQRGWYAIDVRGAERSRADPDQIESLRLAGKNQPGSGAGYPVMEAVLDGSLLRVRVAEFVDLGEAYLWQHKQPATYLLVKLREGLSGLTDAGLAHDLAVGRLATAPRVVDPVAGFTPMQQEAYESCLGAGVRLVWGPPGTGKTRVLAEAIGALMASGKRVLLVSATNIAVDNALLGVVGARHQPGDLLRVGPPHHPDVLKHPEICLPHLVREQLAGLEQQRQVIEGELLRMREAGDELVRLRERVGDFDEQRYRQAKRLLAAEAEIPRLAEAVATAQAGMRGRRQDCVRLHDELAVADRRVQALAGARSIYAEIDRLRQELLDLVAATDDLDAQVLTARHSASQINTELARMEGGGALARIRDRPRIKQHRAALSEVRQRAKDLEPRAQEAKELLRRRRSMVRQRTEQLTATAGGSRADIQASDAALAAAQQAHAQAQALARQAEEHLTRAQQALLAAEARARPTEAQRAMVEHADRHHLSSLSAQLAQLRAKTIADQVERSRLEQEHAKAQEQFDRLRRDAEGEIIRRAIVVATTLARLRTTKALMDGPYDVVLIDEVGAANLPEVLLAVSRARQAAVLLGDFMQLGAIVGDEVRGAERPDIQRWLTKDVFAHCGITTPSQAQGHSGCTALDVQHRFGPAIMGLANAVAYDGLLKPGRTVRAHSKDDPEIVLIDTDKLDDIGRVRPAGRVSGWWPAGALLSRVLADYHQARGERTGVITPYGHQVEATLEALRDQERSTKPVTEVGTAHRFQGREFPVVVFDLVEDDRDKRWIARATLQGSTWERDGTRLFNVAVTRTQTRLYLIGSRTRVLSAPAGSPMGQVAALLRHQRARTVPATLLITPSTVTGPERPLLGPVSSELSEILAQHVRVTDIHDERSFYQAFADHLGTARRSIWIWAPWTTDRVKSLLPVLAEAAARGVKVTLFVRDPGDALQRKPKHQKYLADLRAVLHNVVEINMMHQKIVIIDDETVLLGSLNSLSQSWTREVMLTVRGAHFARKLLEHEHGAQFAAPPRCGACGGAKVDLRRRRSDDWYWRCYSDACPRWSANGRSAWTKPAIAAASARASTRRPSRSESDAAGQAATRPTEPPPSQRRPTVSRSPHAASGPSDAAEEPRS